MPTIAAGAPLVTLVNVFTVTPERQAELAELLTKATEDVMRQMPGFVSASIHTSDDGVRVTNYAQWESHEAYRRMLTDETAKVHMGQAAGIAESFEPHIYTVHSVHET